MSENPYEAPTAVYPNANRLKEKEKHGDPPDPKRVFLKWLAICSISAGPSFFFGLMLSEQRLPQILGMLSGVALFVVAYTLIECAKKTQQQLARPYFRLVTRIGYGTRIAISIIFPLGIALDVMVGIFATAISESILGSGVFPGMRGSFEPELLPSAFMTYVSFLFTTLLQGFFLNCILVAYMGLILAICWTVGYLRGPKSSGP